MNKKFSTGIVYGVLSALLILAASRKAAATTLSPYAGSATNGASELSETNLAIESFAPCAGTYHGLFYISSNDSENTSGSLVATVNKKGAYSAQLRTEGQTRAFSGQFSSNGAAANSLLRPNLSPLVVQLQLSATPGTLTGTVGDGGWTASLAAIRTPYCKTNPAPQAGRYTLLFPGNNSSGAPAGNGFGSVVVNTLGGVSMTGTLGDGTPVSASSVVSGDGQWPLYISLYGGQGSILGWLDFDTNGGIGGEVGWFKALDLKARLYPGGFEGTIDAIGSIYNYTKGEPVLGFTQGELSLTNGNLEEGITNQIEIDSNTRSSAQTSQTLSFQTASGTFKYVVTDPQTARKISVNGIVLQNQNFGAGYFLGTNQSGSVWLSDAAVPSTATGGSETNSSSPPPDSGGDTGAPSGHAIVVNYSNPETNGANPFAIYDQEEFPNAPQARLGYWRFATEQLTNEDGVAPMASQGFSWVPSWNGHAVSFTNTNPKTELAYPVSANGVNYFNPTNGTVRFWFQPNWSNGSANEPTYSAGQSFLSTQDENGGWVFGFTPIGSGARPSVYAMTFAVNQINGLHQPYSFETGGVLGATVNFQSNLWYQIVLAYSPSNVAVYTNGVLLATGVLAPQDTNDCSVFDAGNGTLDFSPISELTGGFCFGNEASQPTSVLGQLTELETFNYPMMPQQVASGFPTFAGNSPQAVMSDSNYVGRSDMLQKYVDGNPASVVQGRLGYWRFDSSALYMEEGQMPLSSNDVSLTPSWSGTALNINSDPASEVTYWDVFTNGWANFNCRQGSVRFWFKPNAASGTGQTSPFFYMGSPDGTDKWELTLGPTGNLIRLATGSNGVSNVNLSASVALSTSNWTQIALTYGPAQSCLYVNGALAGVGSGVTRWPSLTNRNLGLVIGNTTAYNNSINGQFDEIETFNYQLAQSDIVSNFQTVQRVDSDLDGTIDLLEDIILPVSRPYLGTPTVITGTVEAEQFDMGGPGVAYQNVAGNPASSYRPTGMFITNCDDLGFGYCLDQTRGGEWVQYTINVLVPQIYTIETRVAGIGTGGTFRCEFSSPGYSTNTGPLTITTTNWTNASAPVYLPAGANVMRLHFLANGTDGQHVGRFNYISVYPWWQPGFASAHTNTISAGQLSPNNDWQDATNNAAVIQNAIDSLPATGGTVLLPAGTFYVSQVLPNETAGENQNTAIYILTNNVELAGAGKSNTTLIAFNRATTVINLGLHSNGWPVSCSNITLRDMTIEGQPHLAVTNYPNGTSGTVFELGQIIPNGYAGMLTAFAGSASVPACNLLISNCQFLYGDFSVGLLYNLSNCLVTHCDFTVWGGSNVYTGATNNYPTNTPNTWNEDEGVGIFCAGTPDHNVVIADNNYNGNSTLVPSANNPWGYVGTNVGQRVGPDGFVNFQSGGNYFIARNTIVNNSLEAVQLSGGPSAVVGNTFASLANDPSCCAFAFNASGFMATTGTAVDHSACFIGNSVNGGRNGISPQGEVNTPPLYWLNCSGNYFALFPPMMQFNDYPGAAVRLLDCQQANITGNTLGTGGLGVLLQTNCGNALILNNDFTGANYRSIGLYVAGGYAQSATILNNILGEGSTVHVQVPVSDSFGWFLGQNEYLNSATNSVPPFLNPISSAVHFQ